MANVTLVRATVEEQRKLLGASIDLGAGDTRLTVSIWSRNLFNEQHLFYKARFIQKMVSFYIALYDALPKETSWKTAFLENPLEFTLSEATASL